MDPERHRRCFVLQVAFTKWNQSPEDLRLASLNAPHRRTRERFQALYLIASGSFNATSCAAHMKRNDETVLQWVQRYNDLGPDALIYRRTGGRAPFFPRNKPKRLSIRSTINNPLITAYPAISGR